MHTNLAGAAPTHSDFGPAWLGLIGPPGPRLETGACTLLAPYNKTRISGNAEQRREGDLRRFVSSSYITAFCVSNGFVPTLEGFEELPGGWHVVVMETICRSPCTLHAWRKPSRALVVVGGTCRTRSELADSAHDFRYYRSRHIIH